MCKKTLDACHTHDDFVSFGKKKGGRVEPGGRHTKIYGPRGGMVPVPHHKGDLATGTRFSIIKMMSAIGLAGAVLLAVMQAFGG